ncbi:MAG TPA: hypothetical protein ACFCUD_05125 [Cyclobacteriaceae bacterium]
MPRIRGISGEFFKYRCNKSFENATNYTVYESLRKDHETAAQYYITTAYSSAYYRNQCGKENR